MASLKEKIGYALGDAASGGITWKIMSIAFPLFFIFYKSFLYAFSKILAQFAKNSYIAPKKILREELAENF